MTEKWSNQTLFIFATAGAAIGLGNIWKFPYMVGVNGGSAFLSVYLLCVLLIGFPLMLAEVLIGRLGDANPVLSLDKLSQNSPVPLKWLGYWGMFGLIVLLSFYSVIAGFTLAFFYKSLSGHFHHLNEAGVVSVLTRFQSNPLEITFYHTLFMLMTVWVVLRGVNKGLERAMQYLMPLLLILLLILVTYACAVGDVRSTISFLFSFNPELLTPKVIVSAMGHAFFTLALGAGAMITYGAYTHSKTPLVSSVAMIALLDTLVALLAGLAIFPIVFLHQLAPNQGPLLMFVSLPMAFSQMPMGEYLSALFFLFLAVSAWTSSINILETPVAILTSQFNLTRTRACTLIAIISWTLGLGSVFSFNWLKNWTFWDLTFFDLMTLIPDRLILPIGGLCFALIIGYLISRQTLEEALPLKNKIFTSILRTVLRIIAPLTIVIILLSPYIFSDYP